MLTATIVTITGALDSLGASLAPLVTRWTEFLASDSTTLVGSFALLLPLIGALGGLIAPLLSGLPILGPAFAGVSPAPSASSPVRSSPWSPSRRSR